MNEENLQNVSNQAGSITQEMEQTYKNILATGSRILQNTHCPGIFLYNKQLLLSGIAKALFYHKTQDMQKLYPQSDKHQKHA